MAERSILYNALIKPTTSSAAAHLPMRIGERSSTITSAEEAGAAADAYSFDMDQYMAMGQQQEPINGDDQLLTPPGSHVNALPGPPEGFSSYGLGLPGQMREPNNNSLLENSALRAKAETDLIRQRMMDLGLLKGSCSPFTMTEDLNAIASLGERHGVLETEGATGGTSTRISKRKSAHVLREDEDVLEEEKLQQGKKFIDKMPSSLVEECDMVGTALYLSFCDMANLTP